MVGETIMTGSGLVERYASNLHGVLSCFDRIIIVGTLSGACYAQGMTSFLYQKNIRIFDYPKFAEPLRNRIRDRAHEVCVEAGIQIEHVSRCDIRKRRMGRACAGSAWRRPWPGACHLGQGSLS